MNYYCTSCSVQTKNKRNFDIHNSSLRHIQKTNSTSDDTKFKYICGCGKSFSNKPNLCRHSKKCVIRQEKSNANSSTVPSLCPTLFNTLVQQTQIMAETIQKKDSQIELLTNQVSLLLEKASFGTNTNSHNNSNTTNNIETQNVIVVNSFGHENTEHLTDQIICKLIQNGPFTCLPKIIERIHFDPEHPENHNIKVTNQKNNYAKIVKDNKWVTANKKQAIDTMIQNGYGLLEEKYQDNKDTISEFKQERFEDFQEKYCDQDKDLMKTIKDEVDIALLNGTGKLHKQ